LRWVPVSTVTGDPPNGSEERQGLGEEIKMNLKTLQDTPPWDWPEGTGKMLLDALRDDSAPETDLLVAAELAGNVVVVDDKLADALLSILADGRKSEELRSRAAIALGPILEHGDTEGLDDDDAPVSERTFAKIREALRRVYVDADALMEVRRHCLEASVRAPEDWHAEAIRTAYSNHADAWHLTAVFCMGFVRGFESQILESLESKNLDIHREAVVAAGVWELDAAWDHVARLVTSRQTEKPLLLAAIEAAANIRPEEAIEILDDLGESDDEDIAAAAEEAMTIAQGASGDDDDDGVF
jgi:hypothetical protein